MFNKDLNTYKTNWQKGYSQNGLVGGISSVFLSDRNTITNDHIKILHNWNNAVKHGCTNQETFNRIIANADENTKTYFTGLNRGKGSIEGLRNAQNKMTLAARASSVALKGLALAGNMLISMAIVQGISKLISGIQEFANAADNIKEKAKEIGTSFSSTKSDIESYKTSE